MVWGYAGKVRTKIDTVRDYYDESIRNILKQCDKLVGVEFTSKDYKEYSNLKNSLIYCDPPYGNTTKYDGANTFGYQEYWDWCEKCQKTILFLFLNTTLPMILFVYLKKN